MNGHDVLAVGLAPENDDCLLEYSGSIDINS